MDVHARSTYAASYVMSGELRVGGSIPARWNRWWRGCRLTWPGPACYEAGPTGFGLYRAAGAAGIDCQ